MNLLTRIDAAQFRVTSRVKVLGTFLLLVVAGSLLTIPGATAALDMRDTRELINAQPIAAPPLLTPIVESCIGYDIQTTHELNKTAVKLTVRNKCAQNGIDIEAQVDLLIQVSGTTHAYVAQSAKLSLQQPMVVIFDEYFDGIVAQQACVQVHGIWRPVDGSQPPKSFEMHRCP